MTDTKPPYTFKPNFSTMRPTPYLRLGCLLSLMLLFHPSGSGQVQQLTETQRNRTEAKAYRQRAVWDSARLRYAAVVADTKYANPFDRLDYALCCLKSGDTALFARYLGKSIAGGVDTAAIRSFFRPATPAEWAKTEDYVRKNFDRLHAGYLSQTDTVALAELQAMHEMDQLVRTPMIKIISQKQRPAQADSNLAYLSALCHYADSLNYVRLLRLLERRGFPGYHRCGAALARDGVFLLHIDAPYVDWDRMLRVLKQAVLDGEIDPDQVAGVADRHYLRLVEQPSYYYGRLKWGAELPFVDCANVDAQRAEIGLESLAAEYKRSGRPLPPCYRQGK